LPNGAIVSPHRQKQKQRKGFVNVSFWLLTWVLLEIANHAGGLPSVDPYQAAIFPAAFFYALAV
jgi:hypothetical protein